MDEQQPQSYRDLQDASKPIIDETSDVSHEPIRNATERERKLFAPIEDKLQALIKSRPIPGITAISYNTLKPTPESESEARDQIKKSSSADPVLGGILSSYAQEHGVEAQDFPGVLRTDQDLRLSVGLYLTDKLTRLLHIMPERINRNLGKHPRPSIYNELGELESREYASLLALSMLDGSFSSQIAKGDTITYDPISAKGVGQHRYAATLLLSSD